VNRAKLEELADQLGGWEVVDELIDEYLKGAWDTMDDIEAAVEEGDAEALRSAAHSLKGSSLQMNVDGVADLCLELEERGDEGRLDGAGDLAEEARASLEEAERVLNEMREKRE
jgi:HPt (histidine-containing phosphotransfer) domain-containing protein